MDLNRQEINTNMRGGPFPLQEPPGWHPGEPDPRPFHFSPHAYGPYGKPRMRGANHGPESPPTPTYFQRNPSYPPGFDHTHMRNPPGFDNSSHSLHGEIHFHQESLEITSHRPFLPRGRAPPGCSNNVSISSDQFIARGELYGPSQSLPGSVRGRDCDAQGASEGGPSEVLPTKKTKMRKKTKFSPPVLSNAQPAHSDVIGAASSFEPPSLRSSMQGEPPVPRSSGAAVQKSATDNFERATKVCQKLWEDLNSAIQQRERVLRENEQSFKPSTRNKEALEEEKTQEAAVQNVLEEEKRLAAAMKNEIMEERIKLEEEAQRIREEKDAMERTSTDIALQMVELKQEQKQLEKEKAALLALKADLSAKERNSQEQNSVEAAVPTPLGTVKPEIEERVINPCRNCGESCTRGPETRPSNIQNQEPKTARDVPSVSKFSPVARNRNFEFVKVELVTPGSDAAHRDKCKLDDNSREDDMDDDIPLAHRLKSQWAEKTRGRRRPGEKTTQQEESSRRRKSLPHDIHMKRNKVPIEVALQEDAPGLLEQLEEKGLLEDMSVYQDMGSDDALATESPASEFGQLEGVIGKLWGASAGLAKDLIPIKGQGQGSGTMPRYCLACLLSLIEQTKLLRKRNWPVEWGWCRRLRAFLFVFEKHNRIVLERPEYGYATYFFELVQRLPVKWQVQRLITVMSVASTGRAALLENRQLVGNHNWPHNAPWKYTCCGLDDECLLTVAEGYVMSCLKVGTDVTDEEAAILEDYGWNRSSGLGSLLNFCDRVVHDYNKGQDPAELGNDWKQKIGKLLMDGYDQGSILATSIPRKLESVLGNNLSDTGLNMKAEPV